MMGLTPDSMVHNFWFFFRVDNSVGNVSGLGSGVFVPTGVKFKCYTFEFVLFVPIGVKSKGYRLIKIFWRSNSLISLLI